MATGPIPLLIMGGTGRIGRALRGHADAFAGVGLRPIWQSRDDSRGCLQWDILAEPCPNGAATGVVLCLAGVVGGTAEELALNEALAMAACKAAASQGAQHVFLVSSAAVYGRSDLPLTEQTVPAPTSPYGHAKQAMEQTVLAWHRADGPALTILRVGNIAGFDALLGRAVSDRVVQLDPILGQDGGPERSYIGPESLCNILVRLAGIAAFGGPLPRILNVAAAPTIKMGELLTAAGVAWQFGPSNPAAIAKVDLDVSMLAGLVDLPPSAGWAEVMVKEWRGLKDEAK